MYINKNGKNTKCGIMKGKDCSAFSGSIIGTSLTKAEELYCGVRRIMTGVLSVNKL
jgi:hypothetical protein